MKISIVIAAYNVEKYIDRCINSMLAQSYSEIEIIIVNDKSTDATRHICERFCEKDKRIKLINKNQNEGLSAARNDGIDIATGDFITFVDGDDFIEPDTIEQCVKKIQENDVDEIVFGSCFDRRDGTSYAMDIISSTNLYRGKEGMKCYFNEALGSMPYEKNDRNIGITPWGRVYRKEIIDKNHLRFISERKLIYEDLMFLLSSTPYIKSVLIINKPLYHYCENIGSLTQKCDLNRFEKIKTMYNFIKKNYAGVIFQEKETLLRFKRLMLSYIRLSVMQIAKEKSNIGLIKKICVDEFTKEILDQYPIKKLPLKQRVFTYLLDREYVDVLQLICKFYN